MRILFELLGALVFAYLFAKGVSAWLEYRAKASQALKEQQARKTEEKKDAV